MVQVHLFLIWGKKFILALTSHHKIKVEAVIREQTV